MDTELQSNSDLVTQFIVGHGVFRKDGLCVVLLPMGSAWASQIYEGIKTYEYRNKVPKRCPNVFALYETAPVKAITGFVEVEECLEGTRASIWRKTKHGAANLSRSEYLSGPNADCTYAFKIGRIRLLDKPVKLADLNSVVDSSEQVRSVQGFCYLSLAVVNQIIKLGTCRTRSRKKTI